MVTCNQLARCHCRGLCLLKQECCWSTQLGEPTSTLFTFMLPNLVWCNPLPRPLTQPLMDFWCHTHGLSFPVCIVLFGTPFTQIHACDSFSYPGGKLHHFVSYNTAAQTPNHVVCKRIAILDFQSQQQIAKYTLSLGCVNLLSASHT